MLTCHDGELSETKWLAIILDCSDERERVHRSPLAIMKPYFSGAFVRHVRTCVFAKPVKYARNVGSEIGATIALT